MRIEEDKKVISGEHNGMKFTVDGGILTCLNDRWSKKKIRNLIELFNLLQVESIDIVESLPPKRSGSLFESLYGGFLMEEGDGTD